MASISPIGTASNQYDSIQPGTAKAAPARTPAAAEDTVELSAAAQARMLRQEGQSVANIAASLGTNTKTVDEYLGITVTQAIDQALKAAEAAATAKA